MEDLSQSTFGIVDAGIAGGMLGTGIMCAPSGLGVRFRGALRVCSLSVSAETSRRAHRWVASSGKVVAGHFHRFSVVPGTNAVKKRVTVVEGKVEARPIMPARPSVQVFLSHCVYHSMPGSLP